jgi:hypothetical protein
MATGSRRPSDSGYYQDPPNGWAYSTDFGGSSWYLPAGAPATATTRPSRIRQTPMGPMAVGALPEGWRYDLYGNAVTDLAGETWTYDENGRPARVEYSGGMLTGAVGAAAGPMSGPSVTITPVTKEEIEQDKVPVSLIRRQYRKDVQGSIAASEQAASGPFGVTSPGGNNANRPASMGGPLNNPEFLGSELLRENTAAENPGWTATQVDDYVRTYSNMRAARQVSRQYYDKDQAGTYYQRFAMERALAQGYGRPQYGDGYESRLYSMNPQKLRELQQAMIMAKIPGYTGITIGFIGDLSGEDATEATFRNLLAASNLAGVPYDAFLDKQMMVAKLAERAALEDGSPGDPKFDPTRVATSVNLTGRARARAQLKSMMTAMLGRAPTEAEVDSYLNRLNAKEEADPTVRTTTYTRSGDSSTVTEATDVDPVLIGERQIKNMNPKEYKEYQQLNYYNAMLQMMGES